MKRYNITIGYYTDGSGVTIAPYCDDNGKWCEWESAYHIIRERDLLHAALKELAAVVRGECPALLDDLRGGSSRLDLQIDAALEFRVASL